jgi:hypothetical protein
MDGALPNLPKTGLSVQTLINVAQIIILPSLGSHPNEIFAAASSP